MGASSGEDIKRIANEIDEQLEDKDAFSQDPIRLSLSKLSPIDRLGITTKKPIMHLIHDLNDQEFNQEDKLLEIVLKLPELPRTLLQAINYASVSDVSKFMQIYFGIKPTLLSGLIDFHLRMNHDDPLMLCWKVLLAKDIKTLSNDEISQAFNYAERHQLKQIGLSILATQAAISHKKNEYLDNREWDINNDINNIFTRRYYKNLSGADFSNCNISHCDFDSANFTSANLSNAFIYFTHMDSANFTSADLQNVVTNDHFTFTNLTNANISGLSYQRDVFKQHPRTVEQSVVPSEEDRQPSLFFKGMRNSIRVGKPVFLEGVNFFSHVDLLDLEVFGSHLNKIYQMTKDSPHHDDIAKAVVDGLFDRITVMHLQSSDKFTHQLRLAVDDLKAVLLLAYHHPLVAKQCYENMYDYAVSLVNSGFSLFSRYNMPLIETEVQQHIRLLIKY